MNLTFCDRVFEIKNWTPANASDCPICEQGNTLKVVVGEFCHREIDLLTFEQGHFTEKKCDYCGSSVLFRHFYACTTFA